MMKRLSFLVGLSLVGAVASAGSLTVTASGTSSKGEAISALAKFTLTGSDLHVLLENTGTAKIAASESLLSGLFFDGIKISGKVNDSVKLASGSTWIGATPSGPVAINQNYGFLTGLTGSVGTIGALSNGYGFSAVGLSNPFSFGSGSAFHSGGGSMDGDPYTIAPAAGVDNTPHGHRGWTF